MTALDAARQLQGLLSRQGQGIDIPDSMTDKARKQKEWELKRLEEEIAVWERPRQYNIPEGAVQPVVTEGPLTEEEKYARPLGTKGFVMTPQFTKETGIYATPEGKLTNIGPGGDISTPKRRGFEQDEATKMRYDEAIKKREEIKKALAQEDAKIAHLPGYGLFEKGEKGEIGKRIAEEPTAGDWTKTEEGATTLKEMETTGKMSKPDEIEFKAEVDKLSEVQEVLRSGVITGEGGLPRELTPEDRKMLEGEATKIQEKMDSLRGKAPAKEPTKPKASDFGQSDADKQAVFGWVQQVDAATGNGRGALAGLQKMIQAGRSQEEIRAFMKETLDAAKTAPKRQPGRQPSPTVDDSLAGPQATPATGIPLDVPAVPKPGGYQPPTTQPPEATKPETASPEVLAALDEMERKADPETAKKVRSLKDQITGVGSPQNIVLGEITGEDILLTAKDIMELDSKATELVMGRPLQEIKRFLSWLYKDMGGAIAEKREARAERLKSIHRK